MYGLSFVYSVMILDICLMIHPAKVQTSSCGKNISVAYFCANSSSNGYPMFLDTSSLAPAFENVSCLCELYALHDFYLASVKSVTTDDISPMLTVNGQNIDSVEKGSGTVFRRMSITFSAYTGQFGILGCIQINEIKSGTNITATCFPNNESDPSPGKTTKGNMPTTNEPNGGTSREKTEEIGKEIVIVAIVGGLVLVVIILVVVCFLRRRRSEQSTKKTTKVRQPVEDMTENAMYSSADDDQVNGAVAMAADDKRISTEGEYTYITNEATEGLRNHGDKDDDYNHLHQQLSRKSSENVYNEANFEDVSKGNENKDYDYAIVQ